MKCLKPNQASHRVLRYDPHMAPYNQSDATNGGLQAFARSFAETLR
jgi:hypothetical protein